MREIKFRAWDIIKKQMYLSGFTITCKGELSQTFGLYPSRQIVFMQYTGLKDKKGNEIYEGDIVLCPLYPSESNPNGEPDMGIVEYTAGAFGIRYVTRGQNFDSFLELYGDADTCYEEEIIGNIYENKDML